MSPIDRPRAAETLGDLAKLLGFTPKGASYILYKLDPNKKYHVFEIPKKSGGRRVISAPETQLALLQTRLADLLYACVRDRKRQHPRYWFASHGFHPGRTIVSNAHIHRRRRYVFNLDLERFFETINFGRVRGFFYPRFLF